MSSRANGPIDRTSLRLKLATSGSKQSAGCIQLLKRGVDDKAIDPESPRRKLLATWRAAPSARGGQAIPTLRS
jgi:hypothetical protein